MNERIRQLEKQATETVKCGLNGTSTAESFNRKKFAELIIRDCMDVVDGYTKPRTFETHYDAVEQIENLFGVKHERT
jgi:hypothetical protein